MPARILVVDDERRIADSLAEILANADYLVERCYSGAEALQAIQRFTPDVLLADVLMPGMNGFELAMEVKRSCPGCRLVLFSGQAATAQLAQQFIDVFANRGYHFELLPKPIHPDTLLSRLMDSLTRPA